MTETKFNTAPGLIKYNSAGQNYEQQEGSDITKSQVKYSGVESVDSKNNYIKFFN